MACELEYALVSQSESRLALPLAYVSAFPLVSQWAYALVFQLAFRLVSLLACWSEYESESQLASLLVYSWG